MPTRSFFQKVSERLRSTSVASASDSDASDSEDEHEHPTTNNQRPELKKVVSQTVKLAPTGEPLIAHQHHMPCLAEDLCCDSDDSDCDPALNCLPPMGAWYLPQPVPVYPPQTKDAYETITESMFSYEDDIPSTDLVQYSSLEIHSDVKKKRFIKAARK